MTGIIRRLLAWFKSLFVRVPQPLPEGDGEIVVKLPNPIRRKRAGKRDDTGSARYYFDNLLDQLDSYFADIRLLQKKQIDIGAFRRIGCTVINRKLILKQDGLEPYALKNLPGMGCFYTHEPGTWKDDTGEKFYPITFLAFQKIKSPVNVQPSNKPVYEVTAVFKADGKKPFAGQYYVAVSPEDGSVTPLKQCEPVRHKPGFVRMEWGKSPFLIAVVKGSRKHDPNVTVEQAALDIFSSAVNAFTSVEEGITVRVKKNNHTALFCIDMLRTPYFFADREKTVTENGTTKRILHIVRTHERTGAGGVRRFVKTHFRGLRRFTWNGYSVSIGLPGHHHVMLNDFDVATHPMIGNVKPQGSFDDEQIGELVETLIEKGIPAANAYIDEHGRREQGDGQLAA